MKNGSKPPPPRRGLRPTVSWGVGVRIPTEPPPPLGSFGPRWARPMYMITYEQYVSKCTAHFEKVTATSKGSNAQLASGNKWSVSYVQMVKGGT